MADVSEDIQMVGDDSTKKLSPSLWDSSDSGLEEIIVFLSNLKTMVETELEQKTHFSADSPKRLTEAMRYSLLAPGKRLRPTLALLATGLCGGELSKALPVCLALEAVHTYSLIHDDLPSMDNDDYRRGLLTSHRKFDEATAVLAGDALQAWAFGVLAEGLAPNTSSLCISALSRAIGPCGMVGGQVDDVNWSTVINATPCAFDVIGETLNCSDEDNSSNLEILNKRRINILERFLNRIQRRKTGALISVSLELGAVVAGGTKEQIDSLVIFGDYLGRAFQLSDDLLDVLGDERSVGKRLNKDEAAGKLTYVSLVGLDEAKRMLESVTCKARDILISSSGNLFDPSTLSYRTLLYLVDYLARRQQ